MLGTSSDKRDRKLMLSTLSCSLPLCFEKCLGTSVCPSKVFLLLTFLEVGSPRCARVDKRTLNWLPGVKNQGDKLDFQHLQD